MEREILCRPSSVEVCNCMIERWYTQFAEDTFETIFIPLTASFVKYLASEGSLVLPKDVIPLPKHDPFKVNTIDDGEWYDGTQDAQEPEDSERQLSAPSFPDITEAVKAGIKRLGGRVFPKLNWSSPKDAAWISVGNSLQCQTPYDVLLLLKSSSNITHDLCYAFDRCHDEAPKGVEYTLALRRWQDITPSGEFRCFVYKRELIGISQRNLTCFYPFLVREKPVIFALVHDFFKERIRDSFPLENVVFDVYLTARGKKTPKVKIVDFNPFAETTDPLLFEWHELCKPCSISTKMRIVTGEDDVRSDLLASSRLPVDPVDLSSAENIEMFIEMAKSAGLSS